MVALNDLPTATLSNFRGPWRWNGSYRWIQVVAPGPHGIRCRVRVCARPGRKSRYGCPIGCSAGREPTAKVGS